MTYAEELEVTAMSARHEEALMLFNINRVQSFIKEYAKYGHRDLRINQILPYDLQNEIATKTLIQWLIVNGFHYSWEDTHTPADKLRPNTYKQYPELVIHW